MLSVGIHTDIIALISIENTLKSSHADKISLIVTQKVLGGYQ